MANDDSTHRWRDNELSRKVGELSCELFSGRLGSLRPHEQTRALEVAVGMEAGRETEVPFEESARVDEVLKRDHEKL